jgi:O-antigen ligase
MTLHSSRLLCRLLFLFFALFAFCSAFSIAASQMALGVSLVLFLVMATVERHQSFAKPLRWFCLSVLLYVVWLFVTALAGAAPIKSILILKEEWLFLIVPIGIYLFQNEKTSEWLLLSIGAGSIIASVYGLFIFLQDMRWFQAPFYVEGGSSVYQLSGFFSHSLTYGNYMAVVSLFLLGFTVSSFDYFHGWKRTLLVSSIVLTIIATGLSNGRGPILALAVGLILFGLLFKKMRYALVTLLIVILAGSVASGGLVQRFKEQFHVDTQLRYEGGRLFIWDNSLKVIGDHPLLGVGQGNFRDEYIKHLREDIGEHRKLTHAHSDYLNVTAIAGIPGLLLYLGIWVVVLRYLWRGVRAAQFSGFRRSLSIGALLASVGFMVSSLTEATFADEEVRQLMMFIWAAGLSVWYNESTSSEEVDVRHSS